MMEVSEEADRERLPHTLGEPELALSLGDVLIEHGSVSSSSVSTNLQHFHYTMTTTHNSIIICS